MDGKKTMSQQVEYKFLRLNTHHRIPKTRNTVLVYLGLFHIAFIALYAFFARYKLDADKTKDDVPRMYSMWMDVHTMMFVGFGFLMTFLKRYGYSSISFNFLIAAYVLEWALLVRGWISCGSDGFEISVPELLVSDFCAAAVLISFGAVLGKTSLSQLVIMATIEVVLQSVNEYIGLHVLKAVDVGESIYVHVFGAYFGLAVAKVLHNREIESSKESSHYHSDLFSMIGTLFLWLYWPSFNSAVAVDEGQTRAIVNTFLSIVASTITTFLVSLLVSRKRLDMVHIQNATLAGGVAIGAVADLVVQPYGALIVGSLAGILSTVGYHVISPALRVLRIHDTCGVNNLHGMPGLMAGIVSAIVAAYSTPEMYDGYDNLIKFYPARTNVNGTSTITDESERSGLGQAGYQLAALAVTLAIAIIGGILTGVLLRSPLVEQINDEDQMFDDENAFKTPEDYSLKLTEVKVQEEEMSKLTSPA